VGSGILLGRSALKARSVTGGRLRRVAPMRGGGFSVAVRALSTAMPTAREAGTLLGVLGIDYLAIDLRQIFQIFSC